MINYFFLLIGLFISTPFLSAQFIIFSEDFEDHGNTANGGLGRYSSPNDFYITSTDDDYWGRVRASDENYFLTNASSGLIANSNVSYTGQNGSFFYAGEDLDTQGASIGTPDGSAVKEIIFTGINIYNATNMTFKGLFARGENDSCASSAYDQGNYIEIYYDIDQTGEALGMCFNPDIECNIPDDVTNEPLHHDPNCDGDGGEGTILSNVLSEFSFPILGEGLSLDLRISVNMNGFNEEVAMDFFRVESDTQVDDPPTISEGINLELVNSSIYLNGLQQGLILKDVLGKCWKVKVSVSGLLSTELITCPDQ